MSGAATDTDPPPQLAAEYVLGVLDEAEAEAAHARAGRDEAFAAEIRFWEARLLPLTELVAPVEPPALLWARIEATTAGAAPRVDTGGRAANDNRTGLWRLAALASMAVAACLAIYVAVRPSAPKVFAVLSPMRGASSVLVAFAEPGGGILIRPSGVIPVAPDHDLQLWALAAGAKIPVSLGVLPAGGTHVPPDVVPGTQLLVSLEPKGGSPTGLPTGAVLFGGTLRPMN